MRTWVRTALAVLGIATSADALAHEFACRASAGRLVTDDAGEPRTSGGFFVFEAPGAAGAFPVGRYPAVIGVSLVVDNVAPDVSTVLSLENHLAARLPQGTPTWTVGHSIEAGTSFEIGEGRASGLAFRIDSLEQCLALGGVDPQAPVCGGAVDARFVVTHEVGSTECRARLICLPDGTPPVRVAQVGGDGIDRLTGVAVDAAGLVHAGGMSSSSSLAGSPNNGGGDWVRATFGADLSPRFLALFGSDQFDSLRGFAAAPSGETFLLGSLAGSVLMAFGAEAAQPSWSVSGVTGDAVAFGAGDLFTASTTTEAFYGSDQLSGARYDASGGSLEWRATTGGPADELGRAVAPAGDGGAYVAGVRAQNVDADALLARLDAAGAVLWTAILREDTYSSRVSYDDITGVAAHPDGGAVIVGRANFENAPVRTDGYAARFDADGRLLWVTQIGTPVNDAAAAVAVDAAGNAWVTGFTDGALAGPNLGNTDAFVANLAPDGTRRWVVQLGTAGFEFPLAIALDGSGSAYVVGETGGSFPGSTNAGIVDAFVARVGPEVTP